MPRSTKVDGWIGLGETYPTIYFSASEHAVGSHGRYKTSFLKTSQMTHLELDLAFQWGSGCEFGPEQYKR